MNIQELKELAEKATPGPWTMNELEEEYAYEEDYRWISGECWYNFASVVVRMDGQKDICPVGIANARFIAAANPAVVLELIAQRDELLAALRPVMEQLDSINGEIIARYDADQPLIDALKAAIVRCEG